MTPVIGAIVLVAAGVFLWHLVLEPYRAELRREQKEFEANLERHRAEFALKSDITELQAQIRKLERLLESERPHGS